MTDETQTFWIDVNKPEGAKDIGIVFVSVTHHDGGYTGGHTRDPQQRPQLTNTAIKSAIQEQVTAEYPEADGIHSVSRTESLTIVQPNDHRTRQVSITGMAYKKT